MSGPHSKLVLCQFQLVTFESHKSFALDLHKIDSKALHLISTRLKVNTSKDEEENGHIKKDATSRVKMCEDIGNSDRNI